MKYIANSEVYAKVGFFRAMWLRARRAFSQKARDDMEAVRATLAYAEELQEIARIRNKAEMHKGVENNQPEIIVMEGSSEALEELEEYEKIADMDHAASLGMDKVDYNPNALDELYDVDDLDRRIAEETAEITSLIRREKLRQC
jgi:hypothetical protein